MLLAPFSAKETEAVRLTGLPVSGTGRIQPWAGGRLSSGPVFCVIDGTPQCVLPPPGKLFFSEPGDLCVPLSSHFSVLPCIVI